MKSLPRIMVKNDGYVFLIDDKPFIILGAEAHNSACTSRKYMENVWNKASDINCNTILAPVYWELIEPEEGRFEFSLVRELIEDARAHNMRLVLLWFGSWKNGRSTYVPKWIKTDLARFPRVLDEDGVRLNILSMFDSEVLNVETKSFCALMEYIKDIDENHQTVIAVQVENEVGVLETTRDFSPMADKGYKEFEIDDAISEAYSKYPEEVFMGWHYACHMNALAKAGKAIYPLPMFTNVWLKEFEDEKPGYFPCGGPQPGILEVWKKAAPDIDVLAPDIYTFQFDKIASLYTRADNPLLIPETRRDKWAVANLYSAIGTYNAICYSPFGAESIGENKSFINQKIHTNFSDKNVSSEMIQNYLADSYRTFSNMMPILSLYYGTDKMVGFAQDELHGNKILTLGKYRFNIEFYHNVDDNNEYIPGAGIAILVNDSELIFMGYGYKANVETKTSGKKLDFLSLTKGIYDENACWIETMFLNGDEQHVQMEETVTILRAEFYEY